MFSSAQDGTYVRRCARWAPGFHSYSPTDPLIGAPRCRNCITQRERHAATGIVWNSWYWGVAHRQPAGIPECRAVVGWSLLVASLAVKAIPEAEGAGLTLLESGRVDTIV